MEVPLAVTLDVDGELPLQRLELGAPLERLVDGTELVPEADELLVAKLTLKLTLERPSRVKVAWTQFPSQ